MEKGHRESAASLENRVFFLCLYVTVNWPGNICISGLHGVCAGGSMVKIVDLIIGVEYKRTGA